MTNDVLTAAEDYVFNKGWSVIPLRANSKAPPNGFDLAGAFEKPLDIDELRRWLSVEGVSNIGVIMGEHSGLFAVDIDDKAKLPDFDAFQTGLIQNTPSGGKHLLFELTDDMPRTNGHIGAGVDLLVHHKYIVVAPSHVIGERNGVQYEGDYKWQVYGKALKPPQGLFVPKGTDEQEMNLSLYTREQIMLLLNSAMQHQKFVSGMHNDTIFYGSMLLAGDGMSEEMILSLMQGLDSKDPTPQGYHKVRNTVHRAYEIGKQHHQERNQITEINILPDKKSIFEYDVRQAVEPKPAKKKKDDRGLSNVSYYDLRSQYEDFELNWIAQGWLHEGGIMMVAAPPERYKTWLTLDLAVSVATGRPFLGHYPIDKAGNVLVIQQEDFGARLIKRVNTIMDAKISQFPAEYDVVAKNDGTVSVGCNYPMMNEIFFHPDGILSLEDEDSLKRLYQTVVDNNISVVIIDPFYSLSQTDDYYATAANTIRQVIKEIRNRTGCAFIFVHHTKKGDDVNGDPTGRQSLWGSQFLNAAMEGAITMARLKGQNENELTVYRRFKEAEAPQPVRLEFNINTKAEKPEDRYLIGVYEGMSDLEASVKAYLRDNGATKLADLFEEFAADFSSKGRLSEWLQNTEGIVKETRGVYTLAPDAKGA